MSSVHFDEGIKIQATCRKNYLKSLGDECNDPVGDRHHLLFGKEEQTESRMPTIYQRRRKYRKIANLGASYLSIVSSASIAI
ncbi:hypothetical protein YC2023_110851 [Brassica napus]